MAWESILADHQDILELTPSQERDARGRCDDWNRTADKRVLEIETYLWLLIPQQPNPKDSRVEFQEQRLLGEGVASRRAKSLSELYTEIGPAVLNTEMQK